LKISLDRGKDQKHNLDDSHSPIWVLKKPFAEIYDKAATVFAVWLVGDLSNSINKWKVKGNMYYLGDVGGNTAILKGFIFIVVQQYHLKHLSFFPAQGIAWERIENMKYPVMCIRF
jgi:hypothetical protein